MSNTNSLCYFPSQKTVGADITVLLQHDSKEAGKKGNVYAYLISVGECAYRTETCCNVYGPKVRTLKSVWTSLWS